MSDDVKSLRTQESLDQLADKIREISYEIHDMRDEDRGFLAKDHINSCFKVVGLGLINEMSALLLGI